MRLGVRFGVSSPDRASRSSRPVAPVRGRPGPRPRRRGCIRARCLRVLRAARSVRSHVRPRPWTAARAGARRPAPAPAPRNPSPWACPAVRTRRAARGKERRATTAIFEGTEVFGGLMLRKEVCLNSLAFFFSIQTASKGATICKHGRVWPTPAPEPVVRSERVSAAVARRLMLLSPLRRENAPGTWKRRPTAVLVLLFFHLTAPWTADGVSCPLANSVRRRVVRRSRGLLHAVRSAPLAPRRVLSHPRGGHTGGRIDGGRVQLHRIRHGICARKRLNFPAGYHIQQPRGLSARLAAFAPQVGPPCSFR